MKVGSKEFYEIIEDFERHFTGLRFDKEPKDIWARNNIYQNGETNNLFLAFRAGYSAGRCEYLSQ